MLVKCYASFFQFCYDVIKAADGDESDHLDNDMQAETPQLMVGSEEDAEHRMESSTGGASSPTSSSFSSVGSGGDGGERVDSHEKESTGLAGTLI